MDNPRLYLWIGLALLGWMNVVTWNRDYGSPPVAASVTTDPADRARRAETAPRAVARGDINGETGQWSDTAPRAG